MDENKLKEFNIELTALLNKYNVNLTVVQQIQVSPRVVEKKTKKSKK